MLDYFARMNEVNYSMVIQGMNERSEMITEFLKFLSEAKLQISEIM